MGLDVGVGEKERLRVAEPKLTEKDRDQQICLREKWRE